MSETWTMFEWVSPKNEVPGAGVLHLVAYKLLGVDIKQEWRALTEE